METFLRPPMFIYRRLHRIYLNSRPFGTRSGRQSVGLGATRGEQDYDSKLNEFYEDKKMQKLWNNTFERLSSLQKANLNQTPVSSSSLSNSRTGSSQQQYYHNVPQASPNLSGSTSASLGRLAGENSISSSSFGNDASKSSSAMLSPDNKRMMEMISFAEGYRQGADSRKKRKNRIWRIMRETLIIGITIVAVYYITTGDTPFKRVILGNTNYEVQPEEVDVNFAHVKGCNESKQELATIVEFLKDPKQIERLGGKLPKGVLLVGPPGTGKTLLARAVAGEAGVSFFYASGSEFDEVLVGQGARRVRDMFEKAKQRSPCVIFIDEIDSIGGKRTDSVLHPYANQTINQLLSEMDGFNQYEGVIVIGATNREKALDKALLRPGRFDLRVTVPRPDFQGRKDLFEYYLGQVRATKEIDVDMLCRTTVGLTGADIKNLVNQGALRSAAQEMDWVTQDSLEFARDKILMGPERRNRNSDKEHAKTIAYHEGGHTLVTMYTEKANSLHKVTIIPRGNAQGYTSTMPQQEYESHTREQLLAMMDVLLGGRVAEELIYGPDLVSTGCIDDLQKANDLAERMVKNFGMSDKIGIRVHGEDGSQATVSSNHSELVVSEVNRLLEESKKRVYDLLTKHLNELHLLVEALIQYETLDAAEVKMAIEGKDLKPYRQERERERRSKSNNLKFSNPSTDCL